MKGLTLFSLIKIAINHIFVLILAAAVFGGATFAFCKFAATPVYTATGSVLVTNGAILENPEDGKNLENTDVAASINMVDTILDILKTNGIYKNLSDNLGDKYTHNLLSSKANIERRGNTSLFIDVSFSASTREEAVLLVNEYLKLAPEYINTYIPGVDSVAVTSADSASQVFPKTIVFTFLAAVAGAFLSFLIILMIYSTNTVIRNEDDFSERFDIEVLGSIPDFSSARNVKYYRSHYYNYYGKGGNNDGK